MELKEPREISTPVLIVIILVAGLVLAFVYNYYSTPRPTEQEIQERAKMKAMFNAIEQKIQGENPQPGLKIQGTPLMGTGEKTR